MDFSWSEEQLRRRQEMVDFAREELRGDDLVERDQAGVFAFDDYARCAERGLLRLSVPEEYGGRPTDLLTAMLMMEGLGYGCPDNGLTFAINAQLWTVQLPIVRFGSEEQKHRFLPDMCAGRSIGAHALTEVEAGSDAFSLEMRADKRGENYVLNGAKRYVTLAPLADTFLVFASTDPDKGKWGVSAFIVEASRPGVRRGEMDHKMGLRTTPFGEIAFEGCVVPAANRLGPEGAGVSISTHSLEIERCCILASQLGAMERQLEKAVAYARTRTQFGQAIGKFQAVSHRVADMKLRLETARLLLYKVAWLKAQDRPAMMEAALLKLHLSEAFVASGLDAIRIHGGAGYVSAGGVERDLRDAIGGVIYAGTSDIQRNIVARMLGL
jgi:alkylation response protein AidB-like acyl-CoA dehydrogenase